MKEAIKDEVIIFFKKNDGQYNLGLDEIHKNAKKPNNINIIKCDKETWKTQNKRVIYTAGRQV